MKAYWDLSPIWPKLSGGKPNPPCQTSFQHLWKAEDGEGDQPAAQPNELAGSLD